MVRTITPFLVSYLLVWPQTSFKATFVKHLLKSDVNRDTGLANNGLVLFLLLEDGRVYTTDSSAGWRCQHSCFPAWQPGRFEHIVNTGLFAANRLSGSILRRPRNICHS